MGLGVNGQEMRALREQQYTSEQVEFAAEDKCSLDIEEAADIDNIDHNEYTTDKEQVNDSLSLQTYTTVKLFSKNLQLIL